MRHDMTKTNKMTVCPVKTQSAQCDQSLPCALWVTWGKVIRIIPEFKI